MTCDLGAANFSLVTAVALLAAGCAPMTEMSTEAREYRRSEFQNRFILDRARCVERGGRIEVLADGAELNRDGVPEHRVRYYCVLRPS